MVIATPQDFLDVLEKANLLDAEQLAEARQAAEGVDDPKSLARSLVRRELLTRWQSMQLLAGRTTVFFLGKYKLLSLLGRGGMGGVFLAHHTLMNRTVALKTISTEMAHDPARLERFLAEARAIATLDHPNIVHAYNIDKEGDRYYMVMEYVEGQDLQVMVDEAGPLDFERAVNYTRQAAEGLAHAHSRDMIHCDIKPANLIINKQGVVKILDMGMARLTNDKGLPEEKGDSVLGTVDYLAPEQAIDGSDVTPQVDIYSLGCTLYFLLTGRPPFNEGTLHERILKHQTQEPPNLAELRPGVPRELVAICRKMMAKDPAQRYATCSELAKVLADWRAPTRRIRRAVPLAQAEPADEAAAAFDAITAADPVTTARKSKNGRVAKTTDAAQTDSDEASSKRRRLLLFAGLGVAVLLSLAGLIFGLVLSLGSSKHDSKTDKHVAEKTGDHQNGDAGKSGEEKTAEKTSAEKTAEHKTGEQKTSASKTAEQKTSQPMWPDQKTSEQKTAESKTAESKSSEQKTPEKKTPEVKTPEQKTTVAKTPAEKPKDLVKAVPPKPKDVVKLPPKPRVFDDTPKAVNLPNLEEESGTQPADLATVHATGPWSLTLLGAEEAIKGNRTLAMDRKDLPNGKYGWLVEIETAVANKDPTRVTLAKLWPEDESLKFRWADEVPKADVKALRRCLLQIQAGGQTHTMALMSPKDVDALAVDFQRLAAVTAALDFSADPAALHLEVTGVEGDADYVLQPTEPVKKGEPVTVGTKVKTKDLMDTVPVFQVVMRAVGSNVRVELKGDRTYKQAYTTSRSDVEAYKLRVENQVKAAGKNEALKTRLTMELTMTEKRLALLDYLQKMQKVGKVYFRVYMEVGTEKVDLMHTPPPPPRPGAAIKPALKPAQPPAKPAQAGAKKK
jgi:serine/threonine protein kinase